MIKLHALNQRRGLITTIVMAVLIVTGTLFSGPADASDSHLVTIFSDNQERTVNVDVETVGDALDKAGVELGPKDLVEPSRDTRIIESAFKINVYRARLITVIDGDKSETVLTPFRSPRLIAADAGIKAYREDKFIIERIEDILLSGTLGQRMTIIRSTPFDLNLYGNTVTVRTHAATVGQALEEQGVKLGESDIVIPGLESQLVKSQKVAVVRVGQEVVAVNEKIDFPVKEIYDGNHFVGERIIKTAGVVGEKLVTYRLELHDGVEVARHELQTVVITDPSEEVVVVGTHVPDPTSNAAIGKRIAEEKYNWTGEQFTCLYNLWIRESRWNHRAANPTSSAYGIPQALPGSKMATAGSDWETNPETQIIWGLGYIQARYGNPCGAWAHSESHNWY